MIVEIKLPCSRVLKVKLNHGVNLIEDDETIFMLIDGKKIKEEVQDERHLA